MKYAENNIRTMAHNWLVAENPLKVAQPSKDKIYHSMAERCAFSIIEGYNPDNGSWSGDILTIVWDDAEHVTLFYVMGNQIRRLGPHLYSMKYPIEIIKDRLMIWAAEQGEYDPKNDDDEQDYLNFLDTCGFSIIESYNALNPKDWSGDLLTVFWGSSNCFDVFQIDDEKVTQISREQR